MTSGMFFPFHRLVLLITLGFVISFAAPMPGHADPLPTTTPSAGAGTPAAGGGAGGAGGAAGGNNCSFGSDANICTNHPFFDTKNPCSLNAQMTGKNGLLQTIVRDIDTAVKNAAAQLYQAIAGDSGFQIIVGACFSLFIIFFGVAFLFGFVQLTLSQGIIRLVKIGLIVWIISPDGWDMFNEIIVHFFNDGTTQLIGEMITIADPSAVVDPNDPASPFTILEGTINAIFSPRMVVTFVACLTTMPYGLLVGGALGYAIWQFIQAIIKSLMVYCLSLIAKALLFGIAPIFFVFLLFERTKPLFQGWVNQLVNFSLQPILMFAFLAFFSTMIESSATEILAKPGTNVCYVKTGTQGSSPFDLQSWRFVCPNGGGGAAGGAGAGGGAAGGGGGQQFAPYSGQWTANGAVGCKGADNFPISIVNILVFLLIVHLAAMMMDLVTTLAGELAQGVTRLDQVGGGISEFMGGGGGHGGQDLTERHQSQTRPEPRPRTPSGGS